MLEPQEHQPPVFEVLFVPVPQRPLHFDHIFQQPFVRRVLTLLSADALSLEVLLLPSPDVSSPLAPADALSLEVLLLPSPDVSSPLAPADALSL